MMTVKINEDLSFQIGHVTRMGKVDEIFKHGNLLREQKGLRPYDKMKDILKKRSFWEFVVARNTANMLEIQTSDSEVSTIVAFEEGQSPSNGKGGNPPLGNEVTIYSDFSQLDKFFDAKRGEMKVAELIKEFPLLIKSQRGGKPENRGYWMDLHVLLKVATMLDPDLEVQVYDIFIKRKLLEYRDDGGGAFKYLNTLIDTLEDRTIELKPKGNRGCYISIAKLVNAKVNGHFTKGWNDELKGSDEQELRSKYLDKLCSFIEMGFVTTYPQLKETLEKL